MKKKTWVLVANNAEARIFHAENLGHLVEVGNLAHPESRLHISDIVEDRQGRTNQSTGRSRSALEPHTSPKQLEAESFAKIVSRFLDHSREKGKFNRLYIAAAPAFLGMLRQAISQDTHELVAGETNKDLVHMKAAELPPLLPFIL